MENYRRKLIKVGSVWYPPTRAGRKAAREAAYWKHEAWISEFIKRREYGRVRGVRWIQQP